MENFKEALYEIVGERIRFEREKLNISQSRLSEDIGISRASVSNIEVGRHQIPLSNLYAISNVFKIDIKELIPKYEDVLIKMNSKVSNHISHVDKEKFNIDEIDSISQIINNLEK